jgi:predicted outer membrane repeat protein
VERAWRYGGAIRNLGTMTVTNCLLTGNSGFHGGALYSTGTLTMKG